VVRYRKLTRRGKALIYLSCTILLLISAYLSSHLAGPINSFFVGILGKDVSTKFEAPFVEELLKPLGLVILAAVLLQAEKRSRAKNRGRPIRIDWLKSMKVDYAIGYASGFIFGVLESWLIYGTFSGLRSVTPFLHATTTGIVGVGIYYVLTGGNRGIVKLIPLYFLAVLLHSAWNSGSGILRVFFDLPAIIIGIVALSRLLVKHQ